ncbi:head GIN domain-containing protein [Patescibacteria group bacterium]
MTNDQKKALKSILGGLGVIAIIIGAVSNLYETTTGLIIALIIWIIGYPLLKMFGLHPEKEHPSDNSENDNSQNTDNKNNEYKRGNSFWRMLWITVIVIVVILWAFSFIYGRGSGVLASETRDVTDFDKVEISGQGTLIIDQSGEETLKVEADDNLLDRIETEVDNNTLKIRVKTPWLFGIIWPRSEITYHLTVDDLSKVSISGSGKIRTDSLDSESLDISISGSGNADMTLDVKNLDINISGSGKFTLDGNATEQDVNISGSGDYDGKDLISETASFKVAGSGKGIVNVTNTLDVEISGSGSVEYLGDPEDVNQSISGSGKISKYGGNDDKDDDESEDESSGDDDEDVEEDSDETITNSEEETE